MLYLDRKHREAVMIGDDIRISIEAIESPGPLGGAGTVRIGIDAPKDVLILRQELHDATRRDKKRVPIAPEAKDA